MSKYPIEDLDYCDSDYCDEFGVSESAERLTRIVARLDDLVQKLQNEVNSLSKENETLRQTLQLALQYVPMQSEDFYKIYQAIRDLYNK